MARCPDGGQLHGGTKTTRRFDLHDDRGSDEDNYSQGLDTPPLKDRLRLRAGEPGRCDRHGGGQEQFPVHSLQPFFLAGTTQA